MIKLSPKTKLTINDFVPVIPWPQIQAKMPKRMFRQFEKYMDGQTQMEGGVFQTDLNRFLKGLPVVD